MFRHRWVQTGVVRERDLMIVRQISKHDLAKVVEFKKGFVTRPDLSHTLGGGRTHVSNRIRTGQMSAEGTLLCGSSKLWIHPFPAGGIAAG
jgi:hypothetical protein